MSEKHYITTRHVAVTVDESKFTPEFMEEFRGYMFPYFTIDDHREHLAELFARGVLDGWSDEFIEGYGPAKDMGIKFRDLGSETEAVSPSPAGGGDE